MRKINEIYRRNPRPIKVVQFGEGNFLRCFVDYMIDIANEKNVFNGDVAIVKPIQYGDIGRFRDQDNLYTVLLRGRVKGKPYVEKRVVTSIQKVVSAYGDYNAFMGLARLETLQFVVSNTTEAGIVFDETDRFELTPPKTLSGEADKVSVRALSGLSRRFG